MKSNKTYMLSDNDYDALRYWEDRHSQFGFNTLKGVGDCTKGEDKNYAEYESAKYIFKGLLDELALTHSTKVLEIGYGVGFYTKIMDTLTENYIGVDIVDTHIELIKENLKNNSFYFLKNDVGQDIVDNKECDLVYMIDVSQHIVNDDKLSFCLKNNVQSNLKKGGVFIVTDELSNKKYSFYEKTRTIQYYTDNLNMCELIKKPVQFRDKYIFAFKKVK